MAIEHARGSVFTPKYISTSCVFHDFSDPSIFKCMQKYIIMQSLFPAVFLGFRKFFHTHRQRYDYILQLRPCALFVVLQAVAVAAWPSYFEWLPMRAMSWSCWTRVALRSWRWIVQTFRSLLDRLSAVYMWGHDHNNDNDDEADDNDNDSDNDNGNDDRGRWW